MNPEFNGSRNYNYLWQKKYAQIYDNYSALEYFFSI